MSEKTRQYGFPPRATRASDARSRTRSFSAFKSDPAGPEAAAHLREAVRSVDMIRDARERTREARILAESLIEAVEHAEPGNKPRMTSLVGEQLREQSSMRIEMYRLIQERGGRDARPGEGPEGGRGDTASFEFHLAKLIRENPRFAGFGDLVVEVGGNDGVKVRKVDMLAGMMPWWHRRWREIAGVAAVALVTGTISAATCGGNPHSHGASAGILPQDGLGLDAGGSDEAGRRVPANRITPDDPRILEAIGEAVQHKDAVLNITQISEVYDYVVDHVRYLNVSDPVVPRLPAVTLEAGFGDCKSMAVLLASMLEAIGGKTILISWHDNARNSGHQYVGIMLSNSQDSQVRGQVRRSAERQLRRLYSRTIARHYGGRMPQVHTREVLVGTQIQLYLLLDATQGRNSVAGVGSPRPDIESFAESRPGHFGRVPELR
jgi:hypothetical protein